MRLMPDPECLIEHGFEQGFEQGRAFERANAERYRANAERYRLRADAIEQLIALRDQEIWKLKQGLAQQK